MKSGRGTEVGQKGRSVRNGGGKEGGRGGSDSAENN